MITRILSYLLHHANRETKSEEFYKVKDRILSKYGKVVGQDVQFIEGKKCRSCGGRGYHNKYSWTTGKVYDTADCYHCSGGWHRWPTWVLLQRIQFGKYIFHKPVERKYGISNQFIHIRTEDDIINGYIEHTRTKFGKDAVVILFLLYDWKRYWKCWYKTIGRGWYFKWWLPRRWPNTIAHFIRYGRRAYPLRKRKIYIPPPVSQFVHINNPDDLPF